MDERTEMDSVHGPCCCGRLATIPIVVHWKNGDRTYWYCDLHAADVLKLESVEMDRTPQ